MAAELADKPQLAALVMVEAWRRARRRLRIGPIHRWRFAGGAPERLLVTPPDLRRGDPQIAGDIYAGRFYFAGQLVESRGRSPFLLAAPSPAWAMELHAFEWLRHLSEAGDALASANARSLVSDWLRHVGSAIRPQTHDVDITARRIIAWLTHSNIILGEADYAFYRRFMKSLAQQLRYLRSTAPDASDGMPRLRARIALAFGSLCIPTAGNQMRMAARHVSDELDRQVFADGCHISRNPAAIIEILAELLPLRQTFIDQNQPVPRGVFTAIDRMLPAMKFFRHGDGALALFNGAGVSQSQLMMALLRYDETLGDPISQAKQGGYQRLSAQGTVILADTGTPPPSPVSGRAHAGTLSFEFSSGLQRIVVNCGAPSRQDLDWRRLARTTAAHSTLTVADHSSSAFATSELIERFLGTPLIAGPSRVPVLREDSDDGQTMTAAHDGYRQRFGLLHERRLFLSRDGRRIEGTDRLTPAGGGKATPRVAHQTPAAIRFHLHPMVVAQKTGDAIQLAARSETWLFRTDAEADIEDSIFFADSSGARRTLQIVIAFDPVETDSITWRFERRA